MSFDSFRPETSALHTDLYQLTMLQAYWREDMKAPAVFDLFVRRLKDRNYLLACGLEQALEFLETLSFSEKALDYLATHDAFDPAFLDWLATVEFTGDVYAVPEGTPVFPNEPLLEVVAPIGEAQLVETFLLNQLTFQTTIASKASRIVAAARADGTDRLVADFGMRRTHGTDAAMKAARAGYIAGVDATSNVAAGQAYDLPITGTMAHSYIEAHDSEKEAFRAFSDLYPETIVLVDTYDTLDGVRKVIDLMDETDDDVRVRGIRLDSGDLGALAEASRSLLDEAGLTDVLIFVSGGLNEHKIADLLDRGAPIDGFGVGTKMGTSADQPALDTAYKLSGYAGTPRMKLATDKSNLPGRKQVFRQYEEGTAVRDVIATEDGQASGAPLLERVMADGTRTEAGAPRPLGAVREHASVRRGELPPRLHSPTASARDYDVVLSDALKTRLDDTRETLTEAMAGEAT
ncbi:nicotinate phosphoribosyltransferase [Salinibacter altiplanensis]|uniref:nicotinate phosphoribosyltransferase n=1 Tax=Salinibacter altiplanensis TaxID=1803181 RepID=UPI000C9EDE02|nr:nicotinate phosphoribosyltransferase [Salinibacter altiplanensis]